MKKYILFGEQIVFDDAAERTYDIHVDYEFVKARTSNIFPAWYKQQGSIEKTINNFPSFVNQLYGEYLVKAMFPKIQEYGIHDLSIDMYGRRCVCFDGAHTAIEYIEDQYDRIVEKQHAAENYRAERKAYRSRWQGGGFGLSGALKGAATAGALNAVSGLGHSLANATGNMVSAAEASNSKDKLYSLEQTKNTLLSGLYEDIHSFFENHINLLNSWKHDFIHSFFDEERAQALFENAKRFPDKQMHLLAQAFCYCPWNEELQEYIFMEFPDERKEIFRASHDFGTGLEYCVEKLLTKDYSGNAKTNEAEALQAKAKILSIMKEFGLEQSITLNQLETDCLRRLCPDIETADEETCNSYLEAINLYDAQEQNKEPFRKEINDRIDAIWSSEDKAACEHLYLNTSILDPERVKSAISRIKEKSRTEAHEPYIKALENCTKKEIDKARKYRHGIYPKIYASLSWAGFLVLLANIFWLDAGMGVNIVAITVFLFFAIMYALMGSAWDTLTIDGTALHIQLTTDNPQVQIKIPSAVLSIPIAAIAVAAIYFSVQITAIPTQEPTEQTRIETENAQTDYVADAESADEDLPVIYSLIDYVGTWHIPELENESGGYIQFTIESRNNKYYFSASGIWENGAYSNEINDAVIQLDTNDTGGSNGQATGSFRDSYGNKGIIIFTINEYNGPYLSLLTNEPSAHCFNFDHLSCSEGESIRPAYDDAGTAEFESANSLDDYLGDWHFDQYPDSGLSIEKIGDEYYLSLAVVQGNSLRFNGTLESVRLIRQGSYYVSDSFDTMQATTATAQIRPQEAS